MAVLALVAAFAAPVRQACGSTCVEATPPPAVAANVPATGSCHKPELPPEPQPSPEHCTHDHSASLNTSLRVMTAGALDAAAVSPAVMLPSPHANITLLAAVPPQISPGSPPLLLITLRI